MIDLSWVPAERKEKADKLAAALAEACERAEKSKRFIAIQLDPVAEWKGWPAEVAEAWLNKRPGVLFKYFAGEARIPDVTRALGLYFNNTYQPQSGRSRGRPAREPVAGLDVPQEVSEALDGAAWAAMWKFGGAVDGEAMRQALRLPKERDETGDDPATVIDSAGTVTGEANKARYMSARGDLYWADVRNSLDLYIRARPELVAAYLSWKALGKPRAWEAGGEWVQSEGGRVEDNPLVLIAAYARKYALRFASTWSRDGSHASYEVLAEETDFDIIEGPDGLPKAVGKVAKVEPERKQHHVKARYAWGLRDDVDCYSFPVETAKK